MTTHTSHANPRPLTGDQAAILAERLVAQLATLEDQIVEQRAVLADAAGWQRMPAKRVLRALLRWADAHMAALTRLRIGGPRCRRCGDPVSFERLDAQPLTTVCASCPGVLAGSDHVAPRRTT
jgi:RNA polymerase-binding transcription factor DksA